MIGTRFVSMAMIVTFAALTLSAGGCRSSSGKPRERGPLADALNLQRKDPPQATINGSGGRIKHMVIMWLKSPGDTDARRAILSGWSGRTSSTRLQRDGSLVEWHLSSRGRRRARSS